MTFGHGEMPIAHTKHIQGLLNLGSEQPILQDVTSNITGVKCQAGTKRFKDPFNEEFAKYIDLKKSLQILKMDVGGSNISKIDI